MKMSGILIRNADVVTLDAEQPVIRGGDVLIEGDRIAKVGKGLQAPEGAEVLDEGRSEGRP